MKKLTLRNYKEALTFAVLVFISAIFLIKFIDLTPQIDENFFFSTSDPQFQNEEKISDMFLRTDSQLIISAKGNIESEAYYKKIRNLSAHLKKIASVTGVKSLSNGPDNLQDALQSPLWRRLLISEDRKSTNLIVLVEEKKIAQDIQEIEKILENQSTEDFQLNISGLPYIVDLIQRNLLRDLKWFSLLALIIFTAIIFWVFRSIPILTGTMITCLGAAIWTFMVTHLMHIPIGLLTANLTMIIFVLALSHIIFLTYNWKNIKTTTDPEDHVEQAVNVTFAASFWSMLTTLLGFLSLLTVPAKPLRELGISGSVAAVIAIVAAYSLYPAFLRISGLKKKNETPAFALENRFNKFCEHHRNYIRIAILIIFLMALPGIYFVNTDPSMLSFFSKKGDIYQGLKYIDQNGGSSPLIFVVQSNGGEVLSSQASYAKLWKLQGALEKHRSVGSVISLPVILAEAKKNPLANLIFIDWLLNILDNPSYDKVAKSFISEDRQSVLFFLRMNELNRTQTRLNIIAEIKNIITAQGFVPEITGGVYSLQGHLSKLVVSSLIFGLGRLMGLFFIIAWIASKSFKIALSMTFSILIIPLCVLGAIGLYRIPLDVISAPASNIAIAMGIDSMIHLVKKYRRRKEEGKEDNKKLWDASRQEMFEPVFTTMTVIVIGFGILLFSSFPPTQRFGLAIITGTVLAAFTALYIMPLLAQTSYLLKKTIKNNH